MPIQRLLSFLFLFSFSNYSHSTTNKELIPLTCQTLINSINDINNEFQSHFDTKIGDLEIDISEIEDAASRQSASFNCLVLTDILTKPTQPMSGNYWIQLQLEAFIVRGKPIERITFHPEMQKQNFQTFTSDISIFQSLRSYWRRPNIMALSLDISGTIIPSKYEVYEVDKEKQRKKKKIREAVENVFMYQINRDDENKVCYTSKKNGQIQLKVFSHHSHCN